MPSARATQPWPAVVTERVALANGKKIAVHRCPYPSEGPIRVAAGGSGWVLKYMYAHFVFIWPEGTARLDIGHGNLERSLPLWSNVPIPGEWNPRTLALFGEVWAHHHLAKFALAKEDGRDSE